MAAVNALIAIWPIANANPAPSNSAQDSQTGVDAERARAWHEGGSQASSGARSMYRASMSSARFAP